MARTPKLNLDLAAIIGGGSAMRKAVRDAFTLIDTAVGTVLTGAKTHDFANTVDGARATTTVTVTGAVLGDFVTSVSLSIDAAGGELFGYVSAADTVTVVLMNETGADMNLASGTLRVLVRKA